ncbi:MAG: radical SAM protein [Armatimonadetes bacterium]|nr:radical SAM protein [Armatimonadota bacterium]
MGERQRTDTWPAYLALAASGELAERVRQAIEALSECRLCARSCGADRAGGELGYCRTGRRAPVASYGPHFGEERPLVGIGGSGTIFFANCNLRCIFCQNYDISLLGHGQEVAPQELAAMMLSLQRRGCHNINFVTPTHVLPQILEALEIAVHQGLRLPIVWNCGGYESVEALRLLDGIVDIYMPDFKYGDARWAAELSSAPDYPEVAEKALREMHRQVGDLQIVDGLARRGLLVRHLVMPGNVAATENVMRILADISRDTYVNVMAQYRPCYKAVGHPVIGRRITSAEFRAAVQAALAAGLHRLDERWFIP